MVAIFIFDCTTMKTVQFAIFNVLASQRTPPYPRGQLQTNLFTRSLHVPPLEHGSLAHSSISEKQTTDTILIIPVHIFKNV